MLKHRKLLLLIPLLSAYESLQTNPSLSKNHINIYTSFNSPYPLQLTLEEGLYVAIADKDKTIENEVFQKLKDHNEKINISTYFNEIKRNLTIIKIPFISGAISLAIMGVGLVVTALEDCKKSNQCYNLALGFTGLTLGEEFLLFKWYQFYTKNSTTNNLKHLFTNYQNYLAVKDPQHAQEKWNQIKKYITNKNLIVQIEKFINSSKNS
jgi:hypothetical protein